MQLLQLEVLEALAQQGLLETHFPSVNSVGMRDNMHRQHVGERSLGTALPVATAVAGGSDISGAA